MSIFKRKKQKKEKGDFEFEESIKDLDNDKKTKKKHFWQMDVDMIIGRFTKVPIKEKLFFTQYLGVMLKSGISMSEALKTLSKQTNSKYFAKVLKNVAKKVEEGSSFSDSLRSYKKVFGELFVNMIEAGEISGKLEEVLTQLYIQIKKQSELRSKIKGAMIYPVVIIVGIIAVGSFLIVFILPELLGVFKEFDVQLPLPTRVVIAISDFISAHGIISGIVFIAMMVLLGFGMRTYKGKYFFQSIILKFPIISGIVKKINLATFARTTSALLATDVAIIKTFETTANVLGNLHYREAVQQMGDKIKKGSQINEVMVLYPKLFPPVVNQMILVGEDTGELDTILVELAEFYENEIDQIMDNLPAIIEPLLILVLGVAVAGIAAALLMPYYTLLTAI